MTIYENITDRILKQLEVGQIPWRKTWCNGLPKSLTTGREYRGINILVLGAAAFSSRYWVTYREAQRLGGQVRKGEKATPVIYWKWRTADELKKLAKKTGKDNLAPCVPFVSFVFNLDQVDAISRPDDDIQNECRNCLEIADQMFSVMPNKPEIVHAAFAHPAYNLSHDCVTLPHLSQFKSAEDYYAILFHELVHATGHSKRLNRFTEIQGDRLEKYSFEELVAEFGAAFLCGFVGIQNTVTEAQQASYIESWARIFHHDSRILVRAASSAQRAADYIRGKVIVEESTAAA